MHALWQVRKRLRCGGLGLEVPEHLNDAETTHRLSALDEQNMLRMYGIRHCSMNPWRARNRADTNILQVARKNRSIGGKPRAASFTIRFCMQEYY